MRRRPVAIGLLALGALLVALVGGPLGTTAAASAGYKDGLQPTTGPVGTVTVLTISNQGPGKPYVTHQGRSFPVTGTAEPGNYWDEITLTVPTWALPGTANLILKIGTETVTGPSFTVKTPTIASVSPTSGRAGQTFQVDISGFHVSSTGYSFLVNGRPASYVLLAANVAGVPGDHSFTVTVPNFSTTGPLTVRWSSLSDTSTNGVGPLIGPFTVIQPNPEIVDVDPMTGPGGTTITIELTDYPAGTPYVTVGGRPATLVGAPAVPNTGDLTFQATLHANTVSGPVVVRVGGSSDSTATGGHTFQPGSFVVPVATVVSYDPTSAAATESVEVEVADFPLVGTWTATVGGSPVTVVNPTANPVDCTDPLLGDCKTITLLKSNPHGAGKAIKMSRNGISDVGPATFTVNPSTDLAVTLTATPGSGTTATTFIYTLRVRNAGWAAAQPNVATGIDFGSVASIVSMVATPPSGGTATATFDDPNDDVDCVLTTALAPGQTFTCTVRVKFNVGGGTASSLPLTSGTLDWNPANNGAAFNVGVT